MMDYELAALRVREDVIELELARVRFSTEEVRRRRDFVEARLALHAGTLENAPFRTPDVPADPGAIEADPAALAAAENALMRETERLRRSVEARGIRRSLPLLDGAQVATPCPALWTDMVGDHRVRHCLQCDKDVFNLSQMSNEEAEALLTERLGKATCLRFYRRDDGTILTQDCPKSVRRAHFRRAALGATIGIILACGAIALSELRSQVHTDRGQEAHVAQGFQ